MRGAFGGAEDSMITVMGATGNTGRKVAEALLLEGEKVRVLGRSESRLADLVREGAEAQAGYPNEVQYLTRAFTGADAVYTLLAAEVRSPDYLGEMEAQGRAVVEAIWKSGARYVVFLSSLGAELPSGTGPIAGMHAQEERLRKLEGVNILVLRPGSFFENFYSTLGLIKHQGMNGGAVAPDVRIPMIATRDIADVAAEALRARNWEGFVVRELLGPCDLSYAEATKILGERIGRRDLRYVQFPYDEMAAALQQAGFSENVSRLYVEMEHAMNEGQIRSLEGRRRENTTPTRFEDFAGQLAEAYAAA
jgi:uncharacterized protein YbjT (DUF2867 family)